MIYMYEENYILFEVLGIIIVLLQLSWLKAYQYCYQN